MRQILQELGERLSRHDPEVCGDAPNWLVSQTAYNITEFLREQPEDIFVDTLRKFVLESVRFVGDYAVTNHGCALLHESLGRVLDALKGPSSPILQMLRELGDGLARHDPEVCGNAPYWVVGHLAERIIKFLREQPEDIPLETLRDFMYGGVHFMADSGEWTHDDNVLYKSFKRVLDAVKGSS